MLLLLSAHPGSTGQRAVTRLCVCVLVCDVYAYISYPSLHVVNARVSRIVLILLSILMIETWLVSL